MRKTTSDTNPRFKQSSTNSGHSQLCGVHVTRAENVSVMYRNESERF